MKEVIILKKNILIVEDELKIRFLIRDYFLKEGFNILEAENFRLKGRIDDKTYILQIASVFYIESVDEHTFIYCKDKVYETDQKLYQIEEVMPKADFVRISKNCILNIRKLNSVRPLLNGKMEVTLTNGEVQIVNRHYLKDFKEKFDL